ncbi:MAG: hypothetical protein JWM80_1993 [Cyanobacteria bacterium RYN_339]|nr:hypothetical protein [Cyanobacteria bacterium RYN_339]
MIPKLAWIVNSQYDDTPMLLLATAPHLPELSPCDRPLVPALRALGLDPQVVAWDDPTVDWAGADLCVIRSCWDYHLRLPAFLDWAAGVPRLVNRLELVRWNSHKSYLRELAVPTVPTVWLQPGELVDPVALGWEEVVVKPAVSASAHRTVRTRSAMVAELEVLVQPYLPAVEGVGERALVFIDGEFMQAMRKPPVLSGEVDGYAPVEVTAAELELAQRTLAELPEVPLYARVDLLEGLVMELELIEPSLYLVASAEVTARFARAIAARLG